MATSTLNETVRKPRPSILSKVMREAARPFRRLVGSATVESLAPTTASLTSPSATTPGLTGSGAGFASFHPQQATVESEAIPLIQELVRRSRQYPGPIIEIGTLLGITTTNMALAKAPEQKIITVDIYCWNPWSLPPESHQALAATVLHYLIKTGQVEQVCQDKNEFIQSYRGPAPSMVFLDAIHTYEETKIDIEWAQRIGAKIIAGHDYSDQFPGVKQIVDECGGPKDLSASVWAL